MRILVIDDDALVGRSVARVLRNHQVVVVPEHGPAVELARSCRALGCPFEVVLCDQNLTGITGTDVIARLKEEHEDAILILMSGDADELRSAECGDGALLKPFRVQDLVGLVSHARLLRCRAVTVPLSVLRPDTATDAPC